MAHKKATRPPDGTQERFARGVLAFARRLSKHHLADQMSERPLEDYAGLLVPRILDNDNVFRIAHLIEDGQRACPLPCLSPIGVIICPAPAIPDTDRRVLESSSIYYKEIHVVELSWECYLIGWNGIRSLYQSKRYRAACQINEFGVGGPHIEPINPFYVTADVRWMRGDSQHRWRGKVLDCVGNARAERLEGKQRTDYRKNR
jgi:hypothetical protein